MTNVVSCGLAVPVVEIVGGDIVLTLKTRPSDGDVIIKLTPDNARGLAMALAAAARKVEGR